MIIRGGGQRREVARCGTRGMSLFPDGEVWQRGGGGGGAVGAGSETDGGECRAILSHRSCR